MGDTIPAIAARQRDALMQRSGEERLIMGVMMFEAARAMVLASLTASFSSREGRAEYLKRLYQTDLPKHVFSRISQWIRSAPPDSEKLHLP